MNSTEKIRQLCRQIQFEKDPIAFTRLASELNDLLDCGALADSTANGLNGNGHNREAENPYLLFRSSSWLNQLLDLTIAHTAADFGDVQLYDPSTHSLKIVAHKGFKEDFLDYFETVRCDTSCSCGAAMTSRSRVVVTDIASDPVFAGEAREMLLHSDVRSVQSTPLMDPRGRFIGMVSTHYRRPEGPTPQMWKQVDEVTESFMSKMQAG